MNNEAAAQRDAQLPASEERLSTRLIGLQDVRESVAQQLTAARSEQQRLLLEQMTALSGILGYRLEQIEGGEGGNSATTLWLHHEIMIIISSVAEHFAEPLHQATAVRLELFQSSCFGLAKIIYGMRMIFMHAICRMLVRKSTDSRHQARGLVQHALDSHTKRMPIIALTSLW
jgi:hypothetical protein